MKNLLILPLLVFLATPALARPWTDAQGRIMQADLVEVKGPAEAQIIVLKTAIGQTLEVPLSELSAADQAFVKSGGTTGGEVSAKAGDSASSVFKDVLKNKLVAVDGKSVKKYEMESEPKYYAFYFSAHWCPPCRAFTPKFVEFYNSSQGKKRDFEVIFVSSDRDEKSMEEYMTGYKMPWPAVAFRSVARVKEITKYAGNGIPCLVLVDRAGKVISDSYEGKNYVGPAKVMNDIASKAK